MNAGTIAPLAAFQDYNGIGDADFRSSSALQPGQSASSSTGKARAAIDEGEAVE